MRRGIGVLSQGPAAIELRLRAFGVARTGEALRETTKLRHGACFVVQRPEIEIDEAMRGI
jgi:hypothetical protein